MLRKIYRLMEFIVGFGRHFGSRLVRKGPASAYVYARVSLTNLYLRQCNKSSASRSVECPCCGWTGRDFYALDAIRFRLPRVMCPQCQAQERQRMLHIYLERHDPALFTKPGSVLHFAPEKGLRKLIVRNTALHYFATDYGTRALRTHTAFLSDLQRLGVRSESIDWVFCLHVLEHIREDGKSIAEIHRILKRGGVAYIMVPFDPELVETVEWPEPNPDIFGHIWAYAMPDFKERLDTFDFDEIQPATFLSEQEIQRFAVPPKEIIYRCVKL